MEIISGRAGNSGYLRHSGIEVGSGLYCCRSETDNGKRSGHDLVADSGDLVTDRLELAADFFDLGKGGIGGDSLLLQTAKFLLGLNDFSLQSIVFVLPEVTVFELLLCLPLCLLERVQLFRGRADGVLEVFLLLGEKLCVGGIELQQAFNILQLGLRGFYRGVYLFQSLLKSRGIAADLDSNTFYPACHLLTSIGKFLAFLDAV